jgi:hypothetical protein
MMSFLFLLFAFIPSAHAHEAIEGEALDFEDVVSAEIEAELKTNGGFLEVDDIENALEESGALAEEEGHSSFLKMDTAEALKAYVDEQKLTSLDLIVFDVDMVLTMPQNPLFQMPTLKTYREIFKEFLQGFSKAQYDLALMYMVLSSPQIPTHPVIFKMLKKLVETNIPTLYLTAFPTGHFAQMTNAAEWRAFSLFSAGFETQTSPAEGVVYKQFPKYLGSRPMRSGRLLMTNGPQGGVSKGVMLVTYLKEKTLHPKRLYMIDDQPKNLDEVVEAVYAYDRSIKVIPIHYEGALHIPKEAIENAPPQVVTEETFRQALKKIKALVLSNKNIQ